MSELNKEALVDGLIANKAYIWTTRSKFFPKITEKTTLWVVNKEIVIDPDTIADSLLSAKDKIKKVKEAWKNILLVLDKEVFRDDVEEVCNASNIMFLNNKVPSWLFTNFSTFSKSIAAMNNLRKLISSDKFSKLTKKEQLITKRNLSKFELVYKGVTNLRKVPDLVIVVDAEYNTWVIKELEKANINYIAIANTDLSRWLSTDDLIVANTNSYESVMYILNYLLK